MYSPPTMTLVEKKGIPVGPEKNGSTHSSAKDLFLHQSLFSILQMQLCNMGNSDGGNY